jgi:hypothetical protein
VIAATVHPISAAGRRSLSLLRRFRRQSPARQRLLLRAVWTLFLVRVALWIAPSRLVLRRIDRMVPRESSGNGAEARDDVKKVTLAVEAAGRRIPWAATCLTQALTAQALLARVGQRSALRIGVAHGEQGAFKAHAWLEHGGEVVIGDLELGQYTRMPDIGQAL